MWFATIYGMRKPGSAENSRSENRKQTEGQTLNSDYCWISRMECLSQVSDPGLSSNQPDVCGSASNLGLAPAETRSAAALG
jgi:hypothetical protein